MERGELGVTANCVALFRADEDSRATARKLEQRGFAYAIAPVLEPTAVAAQAPEAPFGAVAATSAKAFGFASPALLSQLRDLPVYVVGAAGRRAAELSNLAVAYEAQDARGLARRLASTPIKHNSILYIAGVDRKPDFEALLAASSLAVVVVEVYEARARAGWDESEAAALKKASAALHYSRRSAEVATRLAESAGLATHWRHMSHVAISEDAAAPLRAAGVGRIFVARAPHEVSMLEGLAQLFLAKGAPPSTGAD